MVIRKKYYHCTNPECGKFMPYCMNKQMTLCRECKRKKWNEYARKHKKVMNRK